MIFDLGGVGFLGGAGISAFFVVADAARQFYCRNARPHVERVLRIVGLAGWLPRPVQKPLTG